MGCPDCTAWGINKFCSCVGGSSGQSLCDWTAVGIKKYEAVCERAVRGGAAAGHVRRPAAGLGRQDRHVQAVGPGDARLPRPRAELRPGASGPGARGRAHPAAAPRPDRAVSPAPAQRPQRHPAAPARRLPSAAEHHQRPEEGLGARAARHSASDHHHGPHLRQADAALVRRRRQELRRQGPAGGGAAHAAAADDAEAARVQHPHRGGGPRRLLHDDDGERQVVRQAVRPRHRRGRQPVGTPAARGGPADRGAARGRGRGQQRHPRRGQAAAAAEAKALRRLRPVSRGQPPAHAHQRVPHLSPRLPSPGSALRQHASDDHEDTS